MTAPKTLYDKIWDAHVAHEAEDGTCLLYIDRHLVHEVTSPQAFEGLRIAGREVRAPQKTLAVIDAFRAAYPDDPRGDALLGGWHLGIVLKAGGKNAMKWYSADMSLGLTYYDMALLNSNHDIFIASNFAIALLALDSETYKARVDDLMEHIHQAPAQNALERDIQSRMTTLKNLMDDKEAVKAAAIHMLEG